MIFHEPQREITEIAIGLCLLAGALAVDYRLAIWIQSTVSTSDDIMPLPIAMLSASLSLFAILVVIAAAQSIGAAFCNAAERHGIYLRPRRNRLQ
jgi:TRAP-type C4-dicarboxylate transport system permease small subunit